LKTLLKLSASALPPSNIQRIKNLAKKHVRQNPSVSFFQNDDCQFTFNDLNSDENLVNNDMLNSSIKTRLRFDVRHKAEVTGAGRGSCSSFQSS